MGKRAKATAKREEDVPEKKYTIDDLVDCPRKGCYTYVFKDQLEYHIKEIHNRVNFELEENQHLKLVTQDPKRTSAPRNMHGSKEKKHMQLQRELRKKKRENARIRKKKAALAKEKLKKEKCL